MNLCIIQTSPAHLTETFIRAHIEHIPANVTAVQGHPVKVDGKAYLSNGLGPRTLRVLRRNLGGFSDAEIAYSDVIRKTKADAVLAEYGMSGADVMDICRNHDVPLIVHFHGYDSCRQDVLRKYRQRYETMFDEADAVVAVSRLMKEQLMALGASPEKVYYNPYGVDITTFEQADPASAPPVFLSVGRFVDKKAPHLLLLSFAQVYREHPDSRLRMIGNGPLLGICRDLASALGIQEAVDFLGAQAHHVVRDELLGARAFVLHSIVAEDGDSEGTPNALLEAGASGLPVVSTFHAGIPDVVMHEQTGLLVAERDVPEMALQMGRLLKDPQLAAELGSAARRRVERYFRMDQSIQRLTAIIRSCVENGDRPPLDPLIEERSRKHSARSRA